MNPIRNENATLPPEGCEVSLPTLPPSNKGEQEIFRDDKGCNWIQNGIKYTYKVYHENFLMRINCANQNRCQRLKRTK